MMKILLFSSLLLAGSSLLAQSAEINWISFAEAEKRMAKEPKKVLIDVYTDWCGPCKMMNSTTFTDPETVRYINKHFYAIKFNAEGKDPVTFRGNTFKNPTYDPARAGGRNGTHELTQAIAPVNGRIAYPTIVYMDEQFNILSPVQGMYTAQQIKPILTYFGENIYKTKTWQEYSQGGQ
jgi:thioredoxin-related protein